MPNNVPPITTNGTFFTRYIPKRDDYCGSSFSPLEGKLLAIPSALEDWDSYCWTAMRSRSHAQCRVAVLEHAKCSTLPVLIPRPALPVGLL